MSLVHTIHSYIYCKVLESTGRGEFIKVAVQYLLRERYQYRKRLKRSKRRCANWGGGLGSGNRNRSFSRRKKRCGHGTYSHAITFLEFCWIRNWRNLFGICLDVPLHRFANVRCNLISWNFVNSMYNKSFYCRVMTTFLLNFVSFREIVFPTSHYIAKCFKCIATVILQNWNDGNFTKKKFVFASSVGKNETKKKIVKVSPAKTEVAHQPAAYMRPIHAALLSKTTLCRSFLNVKLLVNTLLQNRSRPEEHYIQVLFRRDRYQPWA